MDPFVKLEHRGVYLDNSPSTSSSSCLLRRLSDAAAAAAFFPLRNSLSFLRPSSSSSSSSSSSRLQKPNLFQESFPEPHQFHPTPLLFLLTPMPTFPIWNLDRPVVLSDVNQFFKSMGVSNFTFDSGRLWEWRCRAKLAVRGSSDNPQIGLYQEGTHTVVDIPHCRGINQLDIQPYEEDLGTGELRYVQMAVTTYNTSLPAAERYHKGKVQVTLVWNSNNEHSPGAEKLNALSEVIFGNRWRHVLGERDFWEHVGGVDICLAPSSFGQANTQNGFRKNGKHIQSKLVEWLIAFVKTIVTIFILPNFSLSNSSSMLSSKVDFHLTGAFDSLLRKLQTNIPYGASIVDIYAGAGIIGLSLAFKRKCRQVLSVKCVEINKESKLSFEKSVTRLPKSVDSSISWHHADASIDPLYWLAGSDVVVVDPPRKGLHPSLLDALRTSTLPNGKGVKALTSTVSNLKDEKRPWVLRAREAAVHVESKTGWERSESWPQTLVYISCGWESFKEFAKFLFEAEHKSEKVRLKPGYAAA
ncbi:hypothetical protein ACLOJK_039843 [Asimina triloba]